MDQEWMTARLLKEQEYHMRIERLEQYRQAHEEWHQNDNKYKRNLNTKLWLTLLGVFITLTIFLITTLLKPALS